MVLVYWNIPWTTITKYSTEAEPEIFHVCYCHSFHMFYWLIKMSRYLFIIHLGEKSDCENLMKKSLRHISPHKKKGSKNAIHNVKKQSFLIY